VAFLDLKPLCDVLVVGRCECPAATEPGIFPSPPALNRNGREATVRRFMLNTKFYNVTKKLEFFGFLEGEALRKSQGTRGKIVIFWWAILSYR
jgi:hypothetical protein